MTVPVSPSVTAVVCSRNGARTIGACLAALDRQTVRARTQVVVVDDGSTDATAAIARSFEVELVCHGHNRGIGAARNTGAARARAPVVAFTDDDCLPEPGWLEALLRAHGRPSVVGVGGPVVAARTTNLVLQYLDAYPPLAPLELDLAAHPRLAGRIVLYLRRAWSDAPPEGARAVLAFPGANMSFTRAALSAVDGFDEGIRFGSDDEDLCSRLRRAVPDGLLWLDPDAVVRHDFAGTLVDLLRRNYAYGRGHARAFLVERERRWPIVFPTPLAVAAMAVGWRRSPRRLLIPLVVTALLPQGPLSALRHHQLDRLGFTGLRLCEEAAHDVGMLTGVVAHRRRRSAAHRSKRQ